jgi:hypothetical protein
MVLVVEEHLLLVQDLAELLPVNQEEMEQDILLLMEIHITLPAVEAEEFSQELDLPAPAVEVEAPAAVQIQEDLVDLLRPDLIIVLELLVVDQHQDLR